MKLATYLLAIDLAAWMIHAYPNAATTQARRARFEL